MKCGYHTVGVIYDTVKVVTMHLKFGVINTSHAASYITPHFLQCRSLYIAIASDHDSDTVETIKSSGAAPYS